MALSTAVVVPTALAEELPGVVSAARSVVAVLPEWPAGAAQPGEVEGSGVAVFEGSTVVTAFHVIAKALSVQVRTEDGRVIDARVAAHDQATDLAILEIDEPLPALDFAADAIFGERVCAIGHPFGFGLSMSCGIVSAVHKAGAGFNPIEDFVQTDAAVNPGMSGGALVRPDGSLVGILSAIFTRGSDGNIGVNFAVAAPLARKVVEDLKSTGRVVRATTGLLLVPAIGRGETGRLAVRVARVKEASPAAAAGIAVDDVITSAAGRPIRKPADFVSVLGRLGPGDELDLTLIRGDDSRKVRLTLGRP